MNLSFQIQKGSEDWDNASAVSKAFSIGRAESGAVSNLQSRVNQTVLTMLKDAVAQRGMRTFITHDLIWKGAFNDGWTSAQGATEAWTQEFSNGQDPSLATSCH